MPLPNLFVIGAPKCGTTSLDRYLDQHPSVSMSAVKEPKFFISEGERPKHTGPGDERACARYIFERGAYEALFAYPQTDPAYAGEASPYYLWHPQAPGRIKELVPQARLIAVLREPVARAYSNWADLKEQGREKLSFDEALAREDERRASGWEPFWFYRDLGLYGEQLSRYFETFSAKQVKVVFNEDLARRPTEVVNDIFEFLGVGRLESPLEATPRNQTMYTPVDRTGRILEAAFVKGQRARALTPRFVRRGARSFVRDHLRERATSGRNGLRLRSRFESLFAADRVLLDDLGFDTSRWDR